MKVVSIKTRSVQFLQLVSLTLICASLIATFKPVRADTKVENQAAITEVDRTALLKSISEKAMLPIFKELDESSSDLFKQTQTYCEAKTEKSLLELRSSWKQASSAWQQADSLLFGPSVDDNIDFTVYFLPNKKGIIKELLNKDDIQLEDVDSAGVGAQGFGTLEYLLFSREDTLSDINNSFVTDSNRCEFLLKATELLHQNISTISRQWKHFGVQFGLAGNNSLFYLESTEAMIELVNKIFQSAQKISIKKVAILDNTKEIKNSAPYKLHAWRSGTSLGQVKANVSGIKRLIDDGGILQWMKSHNKEQATKDIESVMNEILNQKAINDDLFTALQKSPESLQTLVANSLKLTELIKTELAPSLSVELGFNDNDGD